jgi:hypothetical protein
MICLALHKARDAATGGIADINVVLVVGASGSVVHNIALNVWFLVGIPGECYRICERSG